MAEPLTDWEQVKDLLGSNRSPDGGETTLQVLIDGASELIRKETRRRLTVPKQTNETRRFRAYRNATIYLDEMLSRGDILSVTGPYGNVTGWRIEEESYPARGCYLYLPTYATPDFRGEWPASHLDWFTREIRPEYLARQSPNWNGDGVEVTGNWGYSKIPDDIQYLAARTVAIWWTADQTSFSASFNEAGDISVPERLPTVILSALNKHWRAPLENTTGALGA